MIWSNKNSNMMTRSLMIQGHPVVTMLVPPSTWILDSMAYVIWIWHLICNQIMQILTLAEPYVSYETSDASDRNPNVFNETMPFHLYLDIFSDI